MAKDPAFLFYDGDAARDVSHMNRLERGAYFDLIQSQRKFGGYTVEQARKILGKDFDEVWPAIELILSKDNSNVFFIEWVKNSIENRADHAEKQRKRIQDYWDRKKNEQLNNTNSIPRLFRGNTLENENAIENENEDENENKNDRGIRGKGKAFIPPTFEEVLSYCNERGNNIDPQTFIDHYSARDWKPKGYTQKMKDWKATIRTWEKNQSNSQTKNGTGQQRQQVGNNTNSGVSDDYRRSILERLQHPGGQ